jgi:hypothetical protein
MDTQATHNLMYWNLCFERHTYIPVRELAFPSPLVRVWQDGCEGLIPPCFTTWLLSVAFFLFF